MAKRAFTEAQKEHQFKPGQSGNPGGRPRRAAALLSKAFLAWLKEIDPKTGLTNAERVAVAVGRKAARGDMKAAREMRQATEGEIMHLMGMGRDELIAFINGSTSGAGSLENTGGESAGDIDVTEL